MTTSIHGDHDYECLEPSLGDDMWRLRDDACPADLRQRLTAHLEYCAACQLRVALEDRVVAGLRGGNLNLSDVRTGNDRAVRWTARLGGVAVAAGLALVLLLPPRAPDGDLVLRGEGALTVERPVPDEVVRGGQPTIRWTPMAKATRYDVRVSLVGGDHEWSATTRTASVTVPAGEELPVGGRFRVSIEPVPANLAPEGALRSSFRTGGTLAWLGYRARRGATAGRAVSAGGMLAVILAGIGAWWGRRGV